MNILDFMLICTNTANVAKTAFCLPPALLIISATALTNVSTLLSEIGYMLKWNIFYQCRLCHELRQVLSTYPITVFPYLVVRLVSSLALNRRCLTTCAWRLASTPRGPPYNIIHYTVCNQANNCIHSADGIFSKYRLVWVWPQTVFHNIRTQKCVSLSDPNSTFMPWLGRAFVTSISSQ